MRVNFVIGGTQKGGTSALDAFLRQHPQICMPESRKELHFFDREENFRGAPDYEKYHAQFRPGVRHAVLGEASPIYIYWNAAPYRIWSYNRDMKWILILRNPVERAYSAWNMETQRGNEALPFEKAIAQEAARCREALPLQHRVFSYLDRGFYAAQVRRLFNIFGRERCLVLLNEELRTDHQKTLARTFEFLEVDPTVSPANAAVFEHDYNQPLDPGLASRLIDMFYFDIKQLEQLLDRDLSSWYRK
jgi:Sulfotransferase domain